MCSVDTNSLKHWKIKRPDNRWIQICENKNKRSLLRGRRNLSLSCLDSSSSQRQEPLKKRLYYQFRGTPGLHHVQQEQIPKCETKKIRKIQQIIEDLQTRIEQNTRLNLVKFPESNEKYQRRAPRITKPFQGLVRRSGKKIAQKFL